MPTGSRTAARASSGRPTWSAGEATPELGLFVDPSARGMRRYESASVSYGTLDGEALREVSSMCVDCHHGSTGMHDVDEDGNGSYNRHPSYDSERGSTNVISQGWARGTTAPTHWEQGHGSGFDGTTRVRVVKKGATDYVGGGGSASAPGVGMQAAPPASAGRSAPDRGRR